jgi:hypothetical protein
MLTNIVPSGVSLRIVVPRRRSGRARLARRCRFFRLRLEERLLRAVELRLELGDGALQLADLALEHRHVGRAAGGGDAAAGRGLLALLLRLLGRAGREHLARRASRRGRR